MKPCPSCSKMISQFAPVCPNCGDSFARFNMANLELRLSQGLTVLLLALALIFVWAAHEARVHPPDSYTMSEISDTIRTTDRICVGLWLSTLVSWAVTVACRRRIQRQGY